MGFISSLISTALDNNKLLEIDNASLKEGGNAQIYYNQEPDSSFANFQKFDVYRDSEGFVFRNCGSSLVLFADFGHASTRNVDQREFHSRESNNQKWTMKSAGDGYFYIKSNLGDYYLEAAGNSASDGLNVQVSSFTGNDNQKWRFHLLRDLEVVS